MALEGDTETDFHNWGDQNPSTTTVTQPENSTISDATSARTVGNIVSLTSKIDLTSIHNNQEVTRMLESELDQVRNVMNKIEEKQISLNSYPTAHPVISNPSESSSQLPTILVEEEKRKPEDTFRRKFNDSKSNRALEICISMLSELLKHEYIEEFKKPVDVDNNIELHDYHDFIKKPMDLGTVQAKLKRKCYRSPKEFAKDTRLAFHNAIKYNAGSSDTFHFRAREVLDEFNRIYAYQESHYNLNLKVKGNQNGKQNAKDIYKRDMTYEEKFQLCTNLASLPADNLDKVVRIIKKRNSALYETDDMLEVDLISLHVKTLWKLDRFFLKYKRNSRNNQRKALQETDTVSVPLITAPANPEIPREADNNNNIDDRSITVASPVQETEQDMLSSSISSSSSSSSNSDSSSSDTHTNSD